VVSTVILEVRVKRILVPTINVPHILNDELFLRKLVNVSF
jgi:hypothetical protein